MDFGLALFMFCLYAASPPLVELEDIISNIVEPETLNLKPCD